MKFGLSMDVDNQKVDPEGQGHRSKVKVTRSKKRDLMPHLTGLQVVFKVTWVKVKGQMGQGQRSRGSRSGPRSNVKVTR